VVVPIHGRSSTSPLPSLSVPRSSDEAALEPDLESRQEKPIFRTERLSQTAGLFLLQVFYGVAGLTRLVPSERIALIPECAECGKPWLPADEERWQAWPTCDEPPELAFFCPKCGEREFSTD
jgi:hypothetical protein